MFSSIEPERYFWGPALTDVAAGAVSTIAIIVAALALGGFSFFAPWIIVTPVAMFMAGFLRGLSFGHVAAKAVAINLPVLLPVLTSLRGATLLDTSATILATVCATVLCSAAGIQFRRRAVTQSLNAATPNRRRLLLWFWAVASFSAAVWTLFWLFCFLNGVIHGLFGVGRSVIMLLLAGVGMLLAWRVFGAFRETKEATAGCPGSHAV